ncbi:MAG TPA: thioredoxin-disulfide reductase, partial [Pseudonocardiaceae bacterium]|nr:thioredoxin-disulfide reductase [Pseudonocardiaceae bacterium]
AAIDAERWLAEHAGDAHAQVAAEFVGGGYGTKS